MLCQLQNKANQHQQQYLLCRLCVQEFDVSKDKLFVLLIRLRSCHIIMRSSKPDLPTIKINNNTCKTSNILQDEE